MGLLEGKVAIITGAGGGLGKSYALAMAAEGASLVVNDLGGTRDGLASGHSMADAVVDAILATGGKAAASYDSVSDPEGARRIIQTALQAFGRLDILVNNAGILRDKTLLKMEDEDWRAVVAVHLDGTFYCGRAAARYLKENSIPGRIINTTSFSGLMGNFGQSNYGAAKAGIAGLTRVWAKELARYGITVNAVAPMAKTRMTEDIEAVPTDMTPEMVSPMVVYLASDAAAQVNGRIFGVHGRHYFEYLTTPTEGVKDDSDWTPTLVGQRIEAIAATGAPVAVKEGPGGTDVERIRTAFTLMEKAFTPEKAGDWKANLHFLIDGADDHTVSVENGQVTIRTGTHGTPTCQVKVAAPTLIEMIEGRLGGQQAFMAGKIKADNLQDLMRYGKSFDFKKAREAAPASPAAGKAFDPAVFEKLPRVFLPEKAGGWNGSVVFEGGGPDSWSVEVRDKTCSVTRGRADRPACIISAEPPVLADWFAGRLDLAEARASGRLKASNPLALVKFNQCFDWASPILAESATPARAGLNRNLLGKKYRASALFVRPERILSYAEATRDPNPRFREADGLIAPPLFPVTLVRDLIRQVLADDVGGDLTRMVHGEQTIRYHALLRPWDLIIPRAVIADMEKKESGEILHIDQVLHRAGEPVIDMRTSLFYRDDSPGKPKQSARAAEDAPAEGVEFTRTVRVAEDQPYRYAEASGDDNPIHIDPAAARAVGLPGIILHGLCTMAFAGQAVVEECLGGDAERLAELKVRFSRPVLPGDTLTTSGRRRDETTLVFSTVNQNGVQVLSLGMARIRPRS